MGSLLYDGLTLPEFGRGLLDFGLVFIKKKKKKANLRRWWTYLSQLRLTVHHIQGVKNECADYISRNNFDALMGARSEALAKEAFSHMDVIWTST